MCDMELRASQEKDLHVIVQLEGDEDTAVWFGRTGWAWHEEALRNDDIQHLCYVNSDDRAVGFGVVAGLARNGPIELRRLAVARDLRGSGHGRRLLDLLMEHVGHLAGREFIWLDVRENNERARALYVSSGFAPCDPPRGVNAKPGFVYMRRPLRGAQRRGFHRSICGRGRGTGGG